MRWPIVILGCACLAGCGGYIGPSKTPQWALVLLWSGAPTMKLDGFSNRIDCQTSGLAFANASYEHQNQADVIKASYVCLEIK
jgi:hypothetical protein